MSGARDHRRWRAELAAYLLGSLEAEENEALERHLDDCQRCRDELRWLRPAIDLLPETVPQLQPPPQLRERLMAEVRAEAAPGAAPAAVPRRGPFAGLQRIFLRPAAALTAAALIAAVVAGYAIRGEGGGAETTTVEGPPTGTVRATLERSGDSGTLKLVGLQRLPRTHVYQAWVQRDRRLIPSSLFDAHRDGSADAAIPHGLEGADAVMVTRERRGGSRQPTSTPIVNLSLRG